MYIVKNPVVVSPVFKMEQLICLYGNNVPRSSGLSTGIPFLRQACQLFQIVSLLPVIVDHGIF